MVTVKKSDLKKLELDLFAVVESFLNMVEQTGGNPQKIEDVLILKGKLDKKVYEFLEELKESEFIDII